MNLSVGILYGAQRLLQLVLSTPMKVDELIESFSRIEVANTDDVLEISQKCHWLSVTTQGQLRVTTMGENVYSKGSPQEQLKCQLRDIIFQLDPSWAKRIPNGRKEVLRFLPDEIDQIFDEAGLLSDWNDTLLDDWDELALAVRAIRNRTSLKTGRQAERLTVLEEQKRTKRLPVWLARDTNFEGYDVLSTLDEHDQSQVLIEVKGTTLGPSQANFFISRKEWEIACSGKEYWFYLWLIRAAPEFRVVPWKKVEAHISKDQGDGCWDIVRVPFKCFW